MEKEKKEWPDKKTVESNIAEVSEKIEEIKRILKNMNARFNIE